MIRLTIWVLPLVLTCVMVLSWPIFSPGLQCVLGFVNIISALFALSVAITPKRVRSVSAHAMSPVETLGDLPAVPRTRADIFARMDDRQFELFSAAVIMAMGEGHRFLEHCGQSGDQGIDSKLLNIYSQPVVVQSKLYAPDNSVGQPLLRDFLGSIVFHRAVYGFFVTTSSFTRGELAPSDRCFL